jgi:undecaprenyl-diphosphatase
MEPRQQIKKKATGLTLRLLTTVILFIILLLLFYFVADEIVLERNNKFDLYIFQQLSDITSPGTTKLMLFFTFFGSNKFLLPAYTFFVLFFIIIKRNLRQALDMVMVGLTSMGLLFSMKDIFKRTRPLDPLVQNVTGYSFPSGHSFSSFTFCGLLIYMVWQTKLPILWKWILSIFLFLLATTIATTRIYLHVHYASDVLGGFCLSVMWLIISLLILHKIDKKVFGKRESEFTEFEN